MFNNIMNYCIENETAIFHSPGLESVGLTYGINNTVQAGYRVILLDLVQTQELADNSLDERIKALVFADNCTEKDKMAMGEILKQLVRRKDTILGIGRIKAVLKQFETGKSNKITNLSNISNPKNQISLKVHTGLTRTALGIGMCLRYLPILIEEYQLDLFSELELLDESFGAPTVPDLFNPGSDTYKTFNKPFQKYLTRQKSIYPV